MNKENLIKMANHIVTIPQEYFDMSEWRSGSSFSHECRSIGCAVGHCTILDDYKNIPKTYCGAIDHEKWSKKFTGLDSNSRKWDWCFSGNWPDVDNGVLGASMRIKYLAENGKIPPKLTKLAKLMFLGPLYYSHELSELKVIYNEWLKLYVDSQTKKTT